MIQMAACLIKYAKGLATNPAPRLLVPIWLRFGMAAVVALLHLLFHIMPVAPLFGVAAAALGITPALAEHRHLAETVVRLVLQAQQVLNPVAAAAVEHLHLAQAVTVKSS
jgi:hypothetical protein